MGQHGWRYRHGSRGGPDIYDYIAIAGPGERHRARSLELIILEVSRWYGIREALVRARAEEMLSLHTLAETTPGKVYLPSVPLEIVKARFARHEQLGTPRGLTGLRKLRARSRLRRQQRALGAADPLPSRPRR
jgi:hypothetical protein